MFLVSGGYGGSFVDSTEIFDPEVGNWRAGARLPNKMYTLRAANINGQILIFGINILYLLTYRVNDQQLKLIASNIQVSVSNCMSLKF